jgi:hypothetical protein
LVAGIRSCQTPAVMVLTVVVPDSIEWSETQAECFDSVLSHIEILLALTAVFDGWSVSFVDTPVARL